MSEENKKEDVAEAMAAAELEKIRLEIDQLKKRGKWIDRMSPFASLLTVIIAVGGFIFGIVQFTAQQEAQLRERDREAKTKLQERFKNDLDKLLQFTRDEQIATAQVNLLLLDVQECIQSLAAFEHGDGSSTKTTERLNDEVTGMLAQSLLYCDPTKKRHLDFAKILFENWDGLQVYFHDTPANRLYLMNKIEYALSKFSEKDPDGIRRLTYDKETNLYFFSDDKLEDSEEQDFLHLVGNYIYLYKAIQKSESKEKREEFVKRFQYVTCNEPLTKGLFEISFNMKGDEYFNDCN